MGFFFERIAMSNNPYRNRLEILNEVEADGQQVGDDQSADYTADEAPPEQAPAEQPAEEGGGNEQPPAEPGAEDGGPPPPDEGGDNTDYTDMGEGDPEAGGEGDPGGDAPGPEEDSEVDELKAQEEEDLLSSLTPEQLDIKHKELKKQFLEMFDTINAIIERINEVNVAEENLGSIQYVTNTLADLKDMLTDYMNTSYKTKSYIENSINYNRFLAVLGGVDKILEEIGKKED